MTEQQKKDIITLREEGISYSDISARIDIPLNTVKSFYRRHNGSKTLSCKNCGKKFTQPPGTREKKFCSDSCRLKWWNAHRDIVNKKAIYSYRCAYCGAMFRAYGNTHRKYCSRDCYAADRFKGGHGDE